MWRIEIHYVKRENAREKTLWLLAVAHGVVGGEDRHDLLAFYSTRLLRPCRNQTYHSSALHRLQGSVCNKLKLVTPILISSVYHPIDVC